MTGFFPSNVTTQAATYDAAQQRYSVQLQGGKKMLFIRKGNLERAPSPVQRASSPLFSAAADSQNVAPAVAATARGGGGSMAAPPPFKRRKGALPKGGGRCKTPGCPYEQWHMGPCFGEIRSSSKRAKKKDYRLLADEADEMDLGLQRGATEIERAVKRHRIMALEQPKAEGAAVLPSSVLSPPTAPAAHEPIAESSSATLTLQGSLAKLAAQALGAPCSLYASDLPHSGELPEADVARGECSPTRTRSGVLDSLLRASLLRFSPNITGVNYPMTYIGASRHRERFSPTSRTQHPHA